MTDWIKVDAGHMPPDLKPVMATVDSFGKKYVWLEVRYNKSVEAWEIGNDSGEWSKVNSEYDTITHWMPYPAPAQD